MSDVLGLDRRCVSVDARTVWRAVREGGCAWGMHALPDDSFDKGLEGL
jgi:hypothetical protein